MDIETVPQQTDYEHLTERLKKLWRKKAEQLSRYDKFAAEEPLKPEVLYERAGIYAEFGKIVCISTGVYRNQTLWIKSFSGDDETMLLTGFSELVNKAQEKRINYLCAHNGKEFDYPYIIRRLLINGLPVPPILDLSGKKPWEINHLDTLELWKFGDFKNYTSLELLATVFGIPTPKDDIDGSDVAQVYWEEHDLKRITTYCQKDVITIVNLFLRFQGKSIITDDKIQAM
ncbi:MAG: 3'-5' exonuclease [Bacteroidales bacterium]|nr:3'-5' exonuclease [Bacteroidales bacterium]